MVCIASGTIDGWLRLAARLLVVVVLVGSAGCSDQACFSWTEAEGACPSKNEALQFFVPPGCVGSVTSVDSEGEFIEAPDDEIPDDLCCYSVTRTGNEFGFCEGGF